MHVEGLSKDKQAVFAKLHKIKQFITCWNYQLEDTLHNLGYNLYTLLAGLYLLSSEVHWNIISSASWKWQAETMCIFVQINNPTSRSEVIVIFSLLIFSQFLYSETLCSKKLSVLCAREKEISMSRESCGLDFKNLLNLLNPAENSRNCRSLVFLILNVLFEREFWKYTEAEVVIHWYQLEFCLQFQPSSGSDLLLYWSCSIHFWSELFACRSSYFDGSAVHIRKSRIWSEILLTRKSFSFITNWDVLQLVRLSC